MRVKPWWFPAATGILALVALVWGSPNGAAGLAAIVAICTGPVAWVAHRRHALNTREMICLVMFGLCNACSAILRAATVGHSSAQMWSELSTLLSGLMILTAVGSVARNRRGRDFWGVLADGGIVALGSWLLAWVIMVQPALDNFSVAPGLTLVQSAFQPLGAILLLLLIVVVFADSDRTPALWGASLALVIALVGGLLRALQAAGRIGDIRNLSTVCAIVADGVLFATLLHPTMQTLVARQPATRDRPIVGRIIITTAALVIPIIILTATRPAGTTDIIVRTISVGVLSLLVTVRIIQAIRSNREAQLELLRTAQTDSLTGLPNRGLLLDAMNATLRESWKGSGHPTLFFIDLDRFKNINDSFGHAVGDRVLCTIADRLRATVPERATVARISGDEYVVLDPSSPALDDAMGLADRLIAAFREPISLTGGDVFVTASIGVARLEPQSHRNADVLLRHADTAMYQAKEAGRNRVALFDESMHERVAHRLTVETALFRALDRRELKLYYQPILDVTTGEVTGFEALMRWRQGDGTIVSPAEFIPIAEETGTINAIGAWALHEATTQMRTWIDDGVCLPTANMSVNVSPRQLAEPDFPAIVNDALASSGLSSHQLWLEVTEGIMISEPELALATLRRLRSIGVRVALDDFGTGYSSLSLLQKFPLQRIKIDRAFVQGVADNTNDRALVRTIIAMGSSLGLDMVAEGVETVQQLQVLGELGCTKAQGYLISHPMPPDAVRGTVAALQRMGPWPGIGRTREPLVLVTNPTRLAGLA
ncbi:MAG: EAL domain-containing protein [Ilumatobacteraceae bacterium]